MAVLWEMLGNAGNNIYNASRDNADREQRRVASYQQYVASQTANANQARSIALEEQKYADQQNQLNSLKQGLTENAGNTQGIIDTLTAHGQAETAAQVAYTYSQVSKLNQEVALKAEGVAMTKAFGALVAAPDELKDQVYGNIRNYLNENHNVELPPELNTGVLMALGNLGAENNSTYQAMLSNPEMMRSVGSGLLESFTSEGQRRTNDVLGAMVGNAKQEKAHEQQLQERALQVQEGGLGLKQQEFLVGRQDRAFDEGMEVAKLQASMTPKPRQYSEATVQLMEFRDELIANGAGPDQIDTIDAAIKARIEGSKQGNSTNVSIINPETGKLDLTGIVSKDIEKQFDEIQTSRKDRVDVSGAMGAVERLRGTGLETGPGFRARYAAMKWSSYGADADSVKAKTLEDARIIENAGAKFIQWGMAQQGRGFSDADMKWFQENGLSPDNHPAVNKAIADAMQAAYDRQDMYVDMLYDAARRGLGPVEFSVEWREYEKTLGSAIPESSRNIIEGYKKGNSKQQPRAQQSKAQQQQNRLKELFQ